MGSHFIKLCSILLVTISACKGNQSPEYQIDRTRDLFGLTVYFEYLYYDDYWVVPWNYGLPHYTGTVNDIIPEENVFDPYQKAKMRIRDCGNGYACVESPYENYWWGLADSTYSADFYEDLNDPVPIIDGYRFKFYCETSGFYSFERCNIVGEAFSDIWQIYSTSAKRLEYCGNCGDYTWFRFRIKVVQPSDAWVDEQSSQCNTGSTDIDQIFSHTIGVDAPDHNWDFDSTITEEVQNGMKYAGERNLLLEDVYWQVASDEIFREEGTAIDSSPTRIPVGKRVDFQQLVGNYGPFRVKSDNIRRVLVNC